MRAKLKWGIIKLFNSHNIENTELAMAILDSYEISSEELSFIKKKIFVESTVTGYLHVVHLLMDKEDYEKRIKRDSTESV